MKLTDEQLMDILKEAVKAIALPISPTTSQTFVAVELALSSHTNTFVISVASLQFS